MNEQPRRPARIRQLDGHIVIHYGKAWAYGATIDWGSFIYSTVVFTWTQCPGRVLCERAYRTRCVVYFGVG